jgi:hypothetical protein
MSSELLESCRGFKYKHIIEEIVRQVGHLPEKKETHLQVLHCNFNV